MRAFLLIIITLLFSGLFMHINAQEVAVMQAKVKIISGAGFTSVKNGSVDLSSNTQAESVHISAGAFSLITAPGTDVNVQMLQGSTLENELGASIELDTFEIEQIITAQGEHHVSVNSRIKNLKNLSGHYEGAITAVVEYL
jgi:hypothetical protein